VWAHNPEHRLGVPYANRQVAGRYAAGNRDRSVGAGICFREVRADGFTRFRTARVDCEPQCPRRLSQWRHDSWAKRPWILEYGRGTHLLRRLVFTAAERNAWWWRRNGMVVEGDDDD